MLEILRKLFGTSARDAAGAGAHRPRVIHVIPPMELGGKWVAYSGDGRSILAHGDTLAEVREQVRRFPGEDVSYERLPVYTRTPVGASG
jgi:hypothetical protein